MIKVLDLIELPDRTQNGKKETKKMQVTFTLDGVTHKIKFGGRGNSDYPSYLKSHGEEYANRKREQFYKRFSQLKSSSGKLALEDPLSGLYWSARALW